MSYTKREWATGNVVGAVDLNRMEDGIANVDVGYECSEEWVTLTEESVTTIIQKEGDSYAMDELTYSEPITADTIKVTFNGTEYTCNKTVGGSGNFYGAEWSDATLSFDFSTYPFAVIFSDNTNMLFTETAGTYTVTIEAFGEVITTSSCFEKAVKRAVEKTMNPDVLILYVKVNATLDHTFREIFEAYIAGVSVLLDPPVATGKIYTSLTILERSEGLEGGGTLTFGDGRVFTAASDDVFPVFFQGES